LPSTFPEKTFEALVTETTVGGSPVQRQASPGLANGIIAKGRTRASDRKILNIEYQLNSPYNEER